MVTDLEKYCLSKSGAHKAHKSMSFQKNAGCPFFNATHRTNKHFSILSLWSQIWKNIASQKAEPTKPTNLQVARGICKNILGALFMKSGQRDVYFYDVTCIKIEAPEGCDQNGRASFADATFADQHLMVATNADAIFY